MTREALKGAKRPKPLCGRSTIAALRLAALFKASGMVTAAVTACSINHVREGLAGLIQKPRPWPFVYKNASRPSAPLTLTLQGQLICLTKRGPDAITILQVRDVTVIKCIDRNWHEDCRNADI